jgi:hypothetical protein
MKTRDVEPRSSDVAAQMILFDQMQCTFLVSVQGIGSDKIVWQQTLDKNIHLETQMPHTTTDLVARMILLNQMQCTL